MNDTGLRERVFQDLRDSVRDQDPVRVSLVRELIANMKLRQIENKAVADDVVMVDIIERMIDGRKHEIEMLRSYLDGEEDRS